MDAWVKEYGVLNGTALTDAITTDCFLKDFQLTYATLFSGVRHDSGDPYEWGDKMVHHYEKLDLIQRPRHFCSATALISRKQTNSTAISRTRSRLHLE